MTQLWLTVVTVVKDDVPGFLTTARSLAVEDLSGVEYLIVDSSSNRESIPNALVSSDLAGLADKTTYWWEAPRGIYTAMNSALSRAQGRYILFLNAGDCLVNSGVLARAHDSLMAADAVWGYGDVEIADTSGHVVRTPPWDFEFERAHSFARGHFPCHQGTFVSTQALRDIGGFDTRFTIGADYAAFLSLSKVAEPVSLNFVLARFAEGGASTSQWRRSVIEFHRARRNILNPRGSASLLEYIHTVTHFIKLGAYRGIVQRWRT